MSRPPRPPFRTTTTGAPAVAGRRLVVAPNKFGELVGLQRDLASGEVAVSISGDEGDFAQTVVELSALLGHALSVYQDLFAGDAYLRTAQLERSLVRHARRLAYVPDPGVSATGHVALEVGAGLRGTLPAGFAMASVPRGEQKAQDYETLVDVDVDADWNALVPLDAAVAATVAFDPAGAATLRVTGTGLDLAVREGALLIGPSRWLALTIVAVEEDAASGHTLVSVSGGPASQSFDAQGHVLHADAQLPVHLFGWNAPGQSFTAAQLQTQGQYVPLNPATASVGNVSSGYTISGLPGGYNALDVFLAQEVQDPLVGTFVLVPTGSAGVEVCRVLSQATANVTFTVGTIVGISVTTFGTDGTPTTSTEKRLIENSVSGTVSTVRLQGVNGTAVSRTNVRTAPLWMTGWRVQAPQADTEPNPGTVGAFLDLPGDLTAMRPGRPIALADLGETVGQIVELRRCEALSGNGTRIWWSALTALPGGVWQLSDVKVLGNVAAVSHGKSVAETLGGSDGVTPFQTFELKKSPLTLLPSATGVEPALEVRVDDIAWTQVPDFHDAEPRDRVFRLSFDESQTTSVVFSDGKNGALPPAGRKHITANFRTGLGHAGNADRGQVTRIKRAHPLVDSAANLTEIGGGTDPASLEDVRSLAVRYIRTFDRAVSVQDYADLALQFPGVARAAARWDDRTGVRLVTATADGDPLTATPQLRSFLDVRRDTEVGLTLLDPQAVDVHVTLTVEYHPAHLSENVRRGVQDALYGSQTGVPGMFTFAAREFGQPAFASEVYAATERVEGVTFVHVTRLAQSAAPQVFDTLKVTAAQWLRLQPQNCEIVLTVGALP